MQWWEKPEMGLLYLTCEGSMGMRFNDGSNIKAFPFPQKLVYCSKDGRQEKIKASNLKEDKDKLSKLGAMSGLIDKLGLKKEGSHAGVHVRQYINGLSMFVLILSNGVIQCRF